jgi:hypothetical protein
VHHRDLAGRSAKGDKAKLEPKAEGFAKCRHDLSIWSGSISHRVAHLNQTGE